MEQEKEEQERRGENKRKRKRRRRERWGGRETKGRKKKGKGKEANKPTQEPCRSFALCALKPLRRMGRMTGRTISLIRDIRSARH